MRIAINHKNSSVQLPIIFCLDKHFFKILGIYYNLGFLNPFFEGIYCKCSDIYARAIKCSQFSEITTNIRMYVEGWHASPSNLFGNITLQHLDVTMPFERLAKYRNHFELADFRNWVLKAELVKSINRFILP